MKKQSFEKKVQILLLCYFSLTIIQSYEIPDIPRQLDVDCIQTSVFPPEYKTAYPQNKIFNCLTYCEQLYEFPQRAFYNASTQMCEPVVRCEEGYFSYLDNSCYSDSI